MMESEQTNICITSREDVLYLLAEATAIEHNLMCCYLYAAFSLKRSAEEGLLPNEVVLVNRWHSLIVSVAIEEMSHLSLVATLVCALGGRPNFDRPNFPVPAGVRTWNDVGGKAR
jgi:Ferritin-like